MSKVFFPGTLASADPSPCATLLLTSCWHTWLAQEVLLRSLCAKQLSTHQPSSSTSSSPGTAPWRAPPNRSQKNLQTDGLAHYPRKCQTPRSLETRLSRGQSLPRQEAIQHEKGEGHQSQGLSSSPLAANFASCVASTCQGKDAAEDQKAQRKLHRQHLLSSTTVHRLITTVEN